MRIHVERSPASEELLSALIAATSSALVDTSRARLEASGRLEAHMGSRRLPVRMLGLSACLAVEARRMPLVCGTTLRALRRWWITCAEEGWIEYAQIDEALFELARASVSAEPPEAAQSHLDHREHQAARLLDLLRHELDSSRARAG